MVTKEQAKKATVQIIIERGDLSGPLGSGVLYKDTQGRHFLLSAAHVIKKAEELKRDDFAWGIPVAATETPLGCHVEAVTRGRAFHATNPHQTIDLSVVYLRDSELVRLLTLHRHFLSDNDLHLDLTQRKDYWVYGFPGDTTKIDRRRNHVRAKPLSYYTGPFPGDKTRITPAIDKRIQLLLGVSANARAEDKSVVPLPVLSGISGCGIWVFDGDAYTLAGIETSAGSAVLVGNHTLTLFDYVLGRLLSYARHELHGRLRGTFGALSEDVKHRVEAADMDTLIDWTERLASTPAPADATAAVT